MNRKKINRYFNLIIIDHNQNNKFMIFKNIVNNLMNIYLTNSQRLKIGKSVISSSKMKILKNNITLIIYNNKLMNKKYSRMILIKINYKI